MTLAQAIEDLREGRGLTGYFTPAGSDLEAAGVLTWSADEGAWLELLGETQNWPQMGSPHFAVHGSLRDAGDVTLLSCLVRRVAMMDEVTAVSSNTLALGEHVDRETRWPRAIYSTANLSEWRADTGLTYSRPARKTRPGHFRVDSRPPTRDGVTVPGARLTFGGRRDTASDYSADWSIKTWQELVVDADEPLTLAEAWRRFASPLLSLMSFAADRPEGIVREVLVDGRARIEVWRAGATVRPPEWDLRAFLFHADDLVDYAAAIQTWWALDEQLRPALELFAEHINYGKSYSAPRFLTLYTAIEAYARVRHKRNNLRRLRDYASVPESVTGCTDEALALIGATRKYFAHLDLPANAPTVPEIEQNMLPSTRRASALLQACLLRDLGFSAAEVESLMNRHYSRWPLD